jgi:hypothetical protein
MHARMCLFELCALARLHMRLECSKTQTRLANHLVFMERANVRLEHGPHHVFSGYTTVYICTWTQGRARIPGGNVLAVLAESNAANH